MSEREREVQCRSVPQPLCSQTIILWRIPCTVYPSLGRGVSIWTIG
jgi:hypothetical protein